MLVRQYVSGPCYKQLDAKARAFGQPLEKAGLIGVIDDFHFRAVHIPGKLNVDADLLSRNDIPGFRARNPSYNTAPTSLLHQLLMDCLFPTS